MHLKNMKQQQSGHAVKGQAYGCSHIFLRFVYIIVQKNGEGAKEAQTESRI